MRAHHACVLASVLFLGSGIAQAEEIAIAASADAAIVQASDLSWQSINNGGAAGPATIQNRSDDKQMLLRFDLSGVVAPQDRITDVALKLEHSESGTFDVYLATTDDWAEGTSTSGVTAMGDMASWNFMAANYYGSQQFKAAGGSAYTYYNDMQGGHANGASMPVYSGAKLATITVSAAGVSTTSSAALLSAVKARLATDRKVSLMLVGPTWTGHDVGKVYMREKTGTSPVTGQPYVKPTLVVTVGTTPTGYTSAAALNTALAAATPGSVLYVADGTYSDWIVTCGSSGTADRPIVIAPATPGGVTFTGATTRFNLTGNHIVFSGFRFDSVIREGSSTNTHVLLVGQHNRVTQCAFKSCGFQPDRSYARIVGLYYNTATDVGAAYGRVDHNYFYDSRGVSLGIIIGANDPIPSRWPVHSTFEKNWFYKIPRIVSNGAEAIQLCSGGNTFDILMFTTVQNNFLYKADADPEIVSVKCSDNIIRHNTFLNNNNGSSGFTVRGGNRNQVLSNYFINTQYGMRVYGANHVIVNNYIKPFYAGIRIFGVNTGGGTTQGCLFANNTVLKTASFGIQLDAWPSTAPSPGNTWYSNIFQVNASNHATIEDTLGAQAGTWNKNLLFGGAGGWDPPGSTRANPQLTVADGLLLRPAAGSPALNLGIDLRGSPWFIADDIDGHPRGDSTPDAGCDENLDLSQYPPLRRPLRSADVGPDYLGGAAWGDATPDLEAGLPAPLVAYGFNETGTIAGSSGSDATPVTIYNTSGTATDLHTADAQGVSGQSGDRALNLTSATGMGTGHTGPYARQLADANTLDALKSFTVTAWFKTAGAVSLTAGARLMHDQPSGNGAGFFVSGGGSGGTALCNVDNTNAQGAASFIATQQWVFVAVTYDGTLTSDNLKFYTGSSAGSVSLATTTTLNKGAVDENTAPLFIGNNANNTAPFDGMIDNLRIYGSRTDTTGVRTLAQIEAIRQADLANIAP